MKVKEKEWIEYAKTPEAAGVSSKVVQGFLDRSMELGKELHSLMVIRHGKVACEIYREPFNKDNKHMMYSVSKSITSTAIGFAIDEGYFSVDTRFLDIFPEFKTEKLDEYLEELTVEDLLTMRSGKEVSPFLDKTKDRWLQDIMASRWISEPGTAFLYVSENMYVLCAMIHKMVGMSVMEYLKPRLFEPLGIVDPFWETCPRGVEAGGWGMMLSTRDLAKITYCYQQKGKFNGKQVIPEWWVEEATKYHADTEKANNDLDSKVGYGYCFWRNGGYENSYRADGMFCQFGIVFEDLDACVIMTGGEINEQGMRDVIWEFFPKAFIEADEKAESVELSIAPYAKLPKSPRSLVLEKRIDGRTMKLSKPIIVNLAGYPVSIVPLTALFMESDKAGNIDDVSMKFFDDEMIMSWSEGDEVNSVKIGLDGEYRWDKIIIGKIEYNTCSTACWNTENELEIHIRCIEAVAERILKFKFNGDNVVMRPSHNPSSEVMAITLQDSVKAVIKQKLLQTAVSKALPHIVPFVDAVQRGKIK